MIDEIIILTCLIFLLIYGFQVKHISKRKKQNFIVSNSEIDLVKLKNYISSKIFIVGESGLLALLLSLIFYPYKIYIILVWGTFSFLFTVHGSLTVEKHLKVNKENLVKELRKDLEVG